MLLGDPTFPGWQRWMLAPSDASRRPDDTRTSHESARGNKTTPATIQAPTVLGGKFEMLQTTNSVAATGRYELQSILEVDVKVKFEVA